MAKISRRKFLNHVQPPTHAKVRPAVVSARHTAPAVYVQRVPQPDGDGNYHLGPNDVYTLSPMGLEHILHGDVADQVHRIPGAPTQVKAILKGGLHTADGWKRFKAMRPEVVHGAFFRSDVDATWYFARELQNEAIILKIPRELFQSNAAKLTLQADIFSKSGYLWKTLFPPSMTKDQILAAIDESLFHPEEGESDAGIKVGYALLDDVFKALKVRVQVTGTQINSAFPTWSQPSTGNNGRPYTHAESIGFPLAESTVFFGDTLPKDDARTSIFGLDFPSLETLKKETPTLFSQRPEFSLDQRDEELRSEWGERRDAWAAQASSDDIKAIERYLTDYIVLKDPFELLPAFYGPLFPASGSDVEFRTVTAFAQNQIDGFRALASYDSCHATRHSHDYAVLYLRSRFLRIGGLDAWDSKRMHAAILRAVVSRGDPTLASEYLSALSTSPSRIAFYADLDLNPFTIDDIGIIGVTSPNVRVTTDHFMRFAGNSASINYIDHMRPPERDKLARAIMSQHVERFSEFLRDQIRHADSGDLDSFGWHAEELVNVLLMDPSRVDRDALRLVLHDYFRILQLAQYRVLADNIQLLQGGKDLDFDPKPYGAFWVYTKVKHQRDWLKMTVSNTYEHFGRLCSAIGDSKLARYCESRSTVFVKEMIPSPESVPAKYRRWKPLPKRGEFKAAELIELMFPRERRHQRA